MTPVILCVTRDSGPQCSWMSYNETYEADMAGKPRHIHYDKAGKFIESAWGPQRECVRSEQ